VVATSVAVALPFHFKKLVYLVSLTGHFNFFKNLYSTWQSLKPWTGGASAQPSEQ